MLTVEYRAVANIQPGVHLSVLRDVTHRKEAERAMDAANVAARPELVTFKANAPSKYVVKRRDWILAQMRGLGGPSHHNGRPDEHPSGAGGSV